jgi:steroid 5-alpha reductase family enzyme
VLLVNNIVSELGAAVLLWVVGCVLLSRSGCGKRWNDLDSIWGGFSVVFVLCIIVFDHGMAQRAMAVDGFILFLSLRSLCFQRSLRARRLVVWGGAKASDRVL